MRQTKFLLVISLLLGFAARSDADIKFLRSSDLELLYFDPSHTYLAPYAARCFENSLDSQRDRFEYTPKGPVTVLLMDISDYGNASASGLPRNWVFSQISPMSLTFETFSSGERICTLANHELVHVVSEDRASPDDMRFRRLFAGKVSPNATHPETILYSRLTNPRYYAPFWYLEGAAVFMETWMAGGLGRAQGAYDEMVFRSMVRDGAYFYDPLGLVSKGTEVDFQTHTNSYLYGTRFMSFVAYHYSPDKLIQWWKRTDNTKRSYAKEFGEIFGISLDQAWQDWIRWEHEFQQSNLEEIRQFPTTAYVDVSDRALGSVSRAFVDPEARKLYLAVRYPGVVGHLAELSLDDGAIRQLQEIKLPMKFRVSSLAYDADTKTIFYTDDNSSFRDLKAFDTKSGKSKLLLRDARIGDIAFNKADRSLWGVRHLNGLVTLVRIPYPYSEWHQIHTFSFGELLYDLDISADGRLLSSSYGQVNGNQSLRVMKTESLLADDLTPLASFDFGTAVPEGFVFTQDSKYLYGSSYYTGVSNIFRYELATGDIEAVSNTETGFFRPTPLDDGSLLIFHYTGQGFVPAIMQPVPLEDVSATRFLGALIAEKYPTVRDWAVGSPAEIDLETRVTEEGVYRPFKRMRIESVYPVLEGYKDSVGLGLNARLSDSLMFDTLEMSASYTPDNDLAGDERTHLGLSYHHVSTSANPLSGTWSAGFKLNPADFYDIFGPTKQGMKGNVYSLGYEKTLIYDEPRDMKFSLDLDHYEGLERLPNFQNVDTNIDKLTRIMAQLRYANVRSSLGYVDDEKGYKWRLVAADDFVNGETIPKAYGSFDVGFALPLKHSSIWLRNSAGYADGARDDPNANYFFGGFGNNYVDRGEVKRYREIYAMPGFELNEVGGRTFYRNMLEWNLPPIRFRNVGTPGFYLTWARPAIFATNLIVDPDDSSFRRTVTDIGGQIDFRFTILSRLNMTFSLGYASGSGDGISSEDEFMISLKVL